jgi:hypothetical protein
MKHDRAFQIRASEEFMRRIDEWRRQQPDIPSRAEAVRQLVEKAIEADKAAADQKRGSRHAD